MAYIEYACNVCRYGFEWIEDLPFRCQRDGCNGGIIEIKPVVDVLDAPLPLSKICWILPAD